jgi:hypothetical protein
MRPVPPPGHTAHTRTAPPLSPAGIQAQASGPGALVQLLLVGIDRRRLLQRQADIVEAVEEAVLAEGVDVEMDPPAVGAADLLVLEIDRERRVGAAIASSKSFSRSSGLTLMGRMPFLKQLL